MGLVFSGALALVLLGPGALVPVSQMTARPFLGFDGEGHSGRYVLLANSRKALYDPKGIPTLAGLDFLTRKEWRTSINVWYSFEYDVANLVRDLPDDDLLLLYNGQPVKWGPYTLRYLPRRKLEVWKACRKWTYYDVLSFFNCPFIGALERAGLPVPTIVHRGKAQRRYFSRWAKTDLIAYNRAECVSLEALCETLRKQLLQLASVTLPLAPRSWHGAGAIASRLLRSVQTGLHVYPERTYSLQLREVLQRAYFGGRIENFALGTSPGPVYHYDLRSAYPRALCELPRLTWKWTYTRTFQPRARFALYHLRWDLRDWPGLLSLPGPLPWRDEKGYVVYRAEGEGWYWTPEARTVLEAFPGVQVVEGYTMTYEPIYPLRRLVQSLYRARQKAQQQQPLVASVIKLAMNGCYGKLCQSVGTARYHSLAWAGYATSWVRAKMLKAMLARPEAVISVLTDGLITSAPLPVKLSEGLGGWGKQEYSSALVLAPGIYRLGPGKETGSLRRWRGFTVKSFPFTRVVREVQKTGSAVIPMPLFVSHKMGILAPATYGKDRLTFIREDRKLSPLQSHKRHFFPRRNRGNETGANLARYLIGSRMIASPPNAFAPLSAPYTGTPFDEMESQLLDGAELAEYELG